MSLQATDTENTRPIEPCQRFEGHSRIVRGVIHLQDGQQIMTCSTDGSLRVWNLQTGKQTAIWQDGENVVNSIALSVDGKKVVSGSSDGIVRLWSIETGKVLARWTGHASYVWSVCWNQDGVRVLSGSEDGVRVWDVETGKTILQISTMKVYTVIFSPDSTLIATGGDSWEDAANKKFIKIWDANTGKLITILKGHTASVYCLAWTAIGRTLISGSFDFTIRTWDTSTWQQLAVLTGHTSFVHGIAISPNGRILASASFDKTARLWNLDSGQPIGLPLQHPSDVNSASFSTDGTLLATACDDSNAYTWNILAIIKEAGLEELLDVDKSFLHTDAMRRPVQQPMNPRVISTGFFAAISNIPDWDSHITPPISLPVVPEGAGPIPLLAESEEVPPDVQQQSSPEQSRLHFFKWFHSNTSARPTFLQRARLPFFKRPQRRNNEAITALEDAPPEVQPNPPEQARHRFLRWFHNNTPAQPTFPQLARLSFFKRPRRHDGIELVPPVVDVPLVAGDPRNYSARQGRVRTSQQPSPGNITQLSIQSYVLPSSEAHLAASSTTPANPISAPSTTPATPAPNTITQAQQSPVPQTITAFTSSTAPANVPSPVVAASATSLPDIVIPRAGCWTRFVLRIRHQSSLMCCTESLTADGRTLCGWQGVLTGHIGNVEAIAISSNGHILASASGDKTARLWNLKNGRLIGSPLMHPKGLVCVSFSTDGKLLATGCRDSNAYTWDVSAITKEASLNEHLVNCPFSSLNYF